MNKTSSCETNVLNSRRAVLKGAGAIAALAATSLVTQAVAATTEHVHHHVAVDNPRNLLIDSAMSCIKTGDACNQHCIELFKAGDTSVAGCADSVQEMLAACTALTKLAAYDSRHLKTMVQLCMDVSVDCEKECRKHESKHAECKACADACVDCIKACKAYLT